MIDNKHINASNSQLNRWLEELVDRGGSDLLLVADAPASIRREGEVTPLEPGKLTGPEIEAAVVAVLTPHAREQYQNTGIADSSYRLGSAGRFRINLHRQKGEAAAAIRALPSQVPSLSELNLPAGLESLAHLHHGLVLVGGPAGSGKSTTLAALVETINGREARHIVTIEDPVEYEHPHKKSLIEQIEIGVDATDFPTALRSALRQSADVLVVGEMRDPETMKIAVAAAETGHLVLSTLHTIDVASTVSRISDSFPSERQNTIRQELAMAISAVLTQVLVPSLRGGRVPAVELLMVGYGARQHIRRNALQHVHQEITMTKNKGSFTLEDCLAQLVREEKVDREEAMAVANHPDELKSLLKVPGQG